VSSPPAIGRPGGARRPGPNGVTLFATVLILSPLVQWLYLTALSRLAPLAAPFAESSGLALAMQLYFAPGNVLAVVLGVGLARRSESTRRVARFVFLVAVGIAAAYLGMQAVNRTFDSTSLQAATSLVFASVYLWYFGRPHVMAQFQARAATAPRPQGVAAAAASGKATHPRALVACAGVEILLGLAAAALTTRLWAGFRGVTPLAVEAIAAMPAEQGLLNLFIFVAIALLLSPHLLTALASAGFLLGLATTRMARRYSLAACWAAIGCVLLAAWLISRPELEFDVRNAYLIGAFCSLSLVWHLWFLRILARSRSPSDTGPATGLAAR
jgi:hypothetical protein